MSSGCGGSFAKPFKVPGYRPTSFSQGDYRVFFNRFSIGLCANLTWVTDCLGCQDCHFPGHQFGQIVHFGEPDLVNGTLSVKLKDSGCP
jgi:hypothetical protein